jgi:hypothetical protein
MVVKRGACKNQKREDADQRSVYTNPPDESSAVSRADDIIAPDDIL